MGEYLKMSNIFEGEIVVDSEGLTDYSGERFGEVECRYSAHAINSHDELVELLQAHCKAQDDGAKLVRELDVLLNGEDGAAIQASLCDIVAQVKKHELSFNRVDELVENMQHYKQEAEQWEARATNEASRVQDLQADVERLRDMVIRMQTYLDMAGEYPEKESDNPVRRWLFDAIDCTK